MIDEINKPMEVKQKEHVVIRGEEAKVAVFLWGIFVLGLFNISIFAWSAIA